MVPSADKPSHEPLAAFSRSCRHCGRAVQETMHLRATYVVDGFALHTGPTETAVVRRPDSDEAVLVYQRLLRPVVLVTCARCYADPTRREAHLSWDFSDD